MRQEFCFGHLDHFCCSFLVGPLTGQQPYYGLFIEQLFTASLLCTRQSVKYHHPLLANLVCSNTYFLLNT